jgi:hypothetical protein
MVGKVYSDAGTPSNAVGDQGDIFMQLDGLKTTYRKEGGAWTPIGNQLGTIPEFLKGPGVPSNAVGEDGQYYREVNTEAIYQKDAGAWSNIGSWTSLGIQQSLLSNGIGADLAVTNHVSNIDTFIEAGAEGYYDGTTTGTKPSTYGLVKARRENTTYIYQEVHTSDNQWVTRYSLNGGTTWTAWRVTASQDGDNTRRFKALAGVASDDVAVVSQIPTIPNPPVLGIKYFGVLNINGASITFVRQFNLASFIRSAAGAYEVTFAGVGLTGTDYLVLVHAKSNSGDPYNVGQTVQIARVTKKSTTGFKVVCGDNNTDINSDCQELTFIVWD